MIDEKMKLGKEKKSTPQKKNKNTEAIIRIIMICISLIMVALTVFLFPKAKIKMFDSFIKNENKIESEAYSKAYNKAYEKAQDDYHIDSNFILTITSTENIANLEVLSLGTVVYEIQESTKDNGNIASCLEVPGEGTYFVNMKTAEYIVDAERNYVLIRLQKPELRSSIVENKVTRVYFDKKGILNGNTKEGVELADSQYKSASQKIKNELESNAYYFENAKTSAVFMIKNLIKSFHPEVVNLVVDVEFVD